MNGPRLRIMTYNIRSGRGSDDRTDLGRISDVIRSFAPDVLALQEVDCGHLRSGSVDQAEALAAELGMSATFAPCIARGDERYGIATLSRLPVRAARQIELPHRANLPRSLREHSGLSAAEAEEAFGEMPGLVDRLDAVARAGKHRLRPHALNRDELPGRLLAPFLPRDPPLDPDHVEDLLPEPGARLDRLLRDPVVMTGHAARHLGRAVQRMFRRPRATAP